MKCYLLMVLGLALILGAVRGLESNKPNESPYIHCTPCYLHPPVAPGTYHITCEFTDPDGDECPNFEVNANCGTIENVSFPGGTSGTISFDWNTTGCTDPCLEVCIYDEWGNSSCCNTCINDPPEVECPSIPYIEPDKIYPISVDYSDPCGDDCIDYTVTPSCGTIENENFPGGSSGTLTFDWNTAGCTGDNASLEVCIEDQYGAVGCCTTYVPIVILGDSDLVYCKAAGLHSANGETLYVPPASLLPWDVEIDIFVKTDNRICGIGLPMTDLCYDAITMPTYLDPAKNDPGICDPNAFTGTAIQDFDIVALNLYGIDPTPTPPNFLIGAVDFEDWIGIIDPGNLLPYKLAHLKFTVNNTGCICLDTIPLFQPGGGTLGLVTPTAVTYEPRFNEPSCCFIVAEKPCDQCNISCSYIPSIDIPETYEVIVDYDCHDGDEVTSYDITVPCGMVENVAFPGGGASGTLSFDWITEDCPDTCQCITACIWDQFGCKYCCKTCLPPGDPNDPNKPDTVYCMPVFNYSADGETLYVEPSGVWPKTVRMQIYVKTDNKISNVSLPMEDLCFNDPNMLTKLMVPNSFWDLGTAISSFIPKDLNSSGIAPTLSPPNFLIKTDDPDNFFGVNGVMESYKLATLTFIIDFPSVLPGCLCLDSIEAFYGASYPGGAFFTMTTPDDVNYAPIFDRLSCCPRCNGFSIKESKTKGIGLSHPLVKNILMGSLQTISGLLFFPEGINIIDVSAFADCGTIENITFDDTSFSFIFNTEGCTTGITQILITATDEFGEVDSAYVYVELVEAAGIVSIDSLICANSCEIVYVPILLQNTDEFGGFKLLVEWDPNVLTLHDVIRGDCIDEIDFYIGSHNPHYRFEKFMYEWLPCTDIHKKKIKVVGIADMPDGYQGYPIEPYPESCVLAYLKFEVKCDASLKGFFLPIKFEWDSSIWDENTFSGPTGYVWYVSADPEQFPWDPTGPNYEIRKLLYFYNGGIRVDDTGLMWRGDVNLNEYAYEIADAICFANYFITGYLCTYGQEGITDYWYEISEEATDVTADGITLSIADLVYMIRVIMELEEGMVVKVAPAFEVASMTAKVLDRSVVVSSDCDANIGAAAFVFKHSGSVSDVNNLSNMKLDWSDLDGKLRVLIWSQNADFVPAGASDLFSFEAEGAELVGVEVADDMGRAMKGDVFTQVVPKAFALKGNYPNPFNPTTHIAFALPEAGDVSLKIYNIKGQQVWSHSSWYGAGEHEITWQGKNTFGEDVASGIYFYNIQAGDKKVTRKMVLLK